MSERGRSLPTVRNRLVPCGDGARIGVYIIAFYDCPHCMQLLSSYRFKLYMEFIRRQFKTAVVRLIIHPRTYGSFNEFIADPFDRCIANYAQWLARHQGFGYMSGDTAQYWWQTNALSPLILLVPPEPKTPILLPLEMQSMLLQSKPGKPEWEYAMKYVVSYITGKIYTPPLEITRRRRRGITTTEMVEVGG